MPICETFEASIEHTCTASERLPRRQLLRLTLRLPLKLLFLCHL